ncbi:hypothetical protein [Clostridium beijerinckii]|uniref:Uncharacterized protein n=1 Tax=Clostridium beijerinckii TaxID=1520 RepID=A0A1S8S3N4_CLOBE|nr:hypothetical protein [Clostridium beijerinckii]NRY60647.1 hypothetical protein [Clostridium beijerinckii]OOM60047.1 hypothetical protein CLBCK_31250 [Clostridium beijerinckii]
MEISKIGIKEITERYIEECNQVIMSHNKEEAKKLQLRIVAAFQSLIEGIDKNLDEDWLDISGDGCDYYGDYVSNIDILKCKLEVFLATDCVNKNKPYIDKSLNISLDNSSSNSSVNNNTNTNTVDLSIIFKVARKEIEENESMSEAEIKEVIDKINQIEDISKIDESKNKKWFKLRPIMEWLGTKGLVVGTTILNLITAILKFES